MFVGGEEFNKNDCYDAASSRNNGEVFLPSFLQDDPEFHIARVSAYAVTFGFVGGGNDKKLDASPLLRELTTATYLGRIRHRVRSGPHQ